MDDAFYSPDFWAECEVVCGQPAVDFIDMLAGDTYPYKEVRVYVCAYHFDLWEETKKRASYKRFLEEIRSI